MDTTGTTMATTGATSATTMAAAASAAHVATTMAIDQSSPYDGHDEMRRTYGRQHAGLEIDD